MNKDNLNPPKEGYFDRKALSASGINQYYKNPLRYWKTSPFNDKKEELKETPALLFGRVAHKVILEMESFYDEYVVLPELNLSTKAGKEELKEFKQDHEEKSFVNKEELDKALELRASLMKNPKTKALLSSGINEEEIEWTHDCGIKCKGKLDFTKNGLIVDYKTTIDASLEGFSKSLCNFGYHRQAAHYFDGASKNNKEPVGFAFIVQEKDLPDAIGLYLVDSESMEIGKNEVDIAASEIKERLENNSWEAYPQHFVNVGLPHWYKSRHEFNN